MKFIPKPPRMTAAEVLKECEDIRTTTRKLCKSKASALAFLASIASRHGK